MALTVVESMKSEEPRVPFDFEPNDTCRDYACEARGSDHSHVGVQPYLRRVVRNGKVIDGKTGKELERC